jgi:hypothetical protein
MSTKRILILEDDLRTLEVLMRELASLEGRLSKQGVDLSVMVMSEYTQVEKYLESVSSEDFDLMLLDRDCKAGGSFHVFDIEAFGASRVISISSVPEYNRQAEERGVAVSLHKDYSKIDVFGSKLIGLVETHLRV